jgi:hypothetical protein
LALTDECDDDDDDSGCINCDTGREIGVDAGGGANGEGETDTEVDAAPTLMTGGVGSIGLCDTEVEAATEADVTNGDLDF